VLVTGSAGAVGTALLRELRNEYELIGLDAAPGPSTDIVADMTDLDEVLGAFEGVDMVIDLAANSEVGATWQEVATNNLPATRNALEAARRGGVRRFLFASSHHVVGLYERDEPYASIVSGAYDGIDPQSFKRIAAHAPIRPDGFYAVGKVVGEAMLRLYSDVHGLSAIALRIGTVHPADRPLNPRQFATLLTHRDLGQLVRRCLEAPPDLPFSVFYGVSANRWRLWEIDNAKKLIGYAPVDNAESWR